MDKPELEQPAIWLVLSDDKMAEARDLLRLGHWRGAVSLAYYSMFYAAKAALVSVGVDLRKHRQAGSTLSEHFVRTGLLDQKFNRLLMKAMRARELSDYDPRQIVTEEDAKSALDNAEQFVKAIRKLLQP